RKQKIRASFSSTGRLPHRMLLYTIHPWILFSFARRSSLSEGSLRPCNYVHLSTTLAIVTPYLPTLMLSNCPCSKSLGAGCSCQSRTAPLSDLQPWNPERMEKERMEKANWTHCLLTQECNAMALDDGCSRPAPSSHEHKDLAPCT